MSALIGRAIGPSHNTAKTDPETKEVEYSYLAEVWCSRSGVEIRLLVPADQLRFEPLAARNFAWLLVRAAEEVERMRSSRRQKTLATAATVAAMITSVRSAGT